MDNSKKKVHLSGPLGLMLESDDIEPIGSNLFRSNSMGVDFTKNELLLVDPLACEPWKYANRLDDDYGDLSGLIDSIKNNNQLQPGLVRKHPNPHGKIKYEVIFGCRRRKACEKLNTKFLVIVKDDLSDIDAASYQYDENKKRNDSSNYSDALLYRRMLDAGLFDSERQLAQSIGESKSKVNELLTFTKIPNELIKVIPDIHTVPVYLAVKIYRIIKSNEENYKTMLAIAPKIGINIKSVADLEKFFSDKKVATKVDKPDSMVLKDSVGSPVFSIKPDSKGCPVIKVSKKAAKACDLRDLYSHLKLFFES